MRTASEVDRERAETAKQVIRATRDNNERFVAGLPATTDERICRIRQQLLEGSRFCTGIACDDCGTELTNDGTLLLGIPPKRWHDCPACGKRHLIRE